MRNRIDIDKKTRHAIIRDIGERLRAIVRKDPEVPTSLGEQIDRRRELAMAADRKPESMGSRTSHASR